MDAATIADQSTRLASDAAKLVEEALKIAWSEMVGLIAAHYDTTIEYANLIVGTIGDARPGYAAGMLNNRGSSSENYVTCQIAITKELRRTGQPFKP